MLSSEKQQKMNFPEELISRDCFKSSSLVWEMKVCSRGDSSIWVSSFVGSGVGGPLSRSVDSLSMATSQVTVVADMMR